ncbi:MAG: DUF4364 family protein [Ruminococcaceae bacterium]|nr:DUF4364 family protein [Oscillospiraceae bacterium]
MEFDAFTAGIEPGGLRTKNDIRIMVCYILNSVKAPLSKENILNILQEKGLANYFEINDAISYLNNNGSIVVDGEDFCTITEKGKHIADELDVTLSLSARDKAMEAAFTMLSEAKREKENHVDIVRTELGYNVTCHVSGGDMDLMALTLYVPDLYQAKMVKKKFHKNPEAIYKLMLSSLTGNRELLRSLMDEV